MSCFVELNYSCMSLTPHHPVLCRCTSCRGWCCNHGSKAGREKARGKRQRERVGSERKSRTKIQRRGKKEEGREEEKGEGRGRRREEDQRMDRRWNADVSFHVTWPSNLLSSLHVATDLSVFESIVLGHQRLCISPIHPLLDLPVQMAITTCDDTMRTDSSLEVQKLFCHFPPAPHPIILIISCIKAYPHLSPSLSWIKLGGHASLSLIGSFAGTLLYVTFAKGVFLCRWFLASCSDWFPVTCHPSVTWCQKLLIWMRACVFVCLRVRAFLFLHFSVLHPRIHLSLFMSSICS